jgi:hypothetical protein
MSNLSADSLKRQTGINEWYFNYRLDTLFVLQLLFLGLSLLILLTILSKYGIVSSVFVGYYTILMLVGVFIVWYFKYIYNANNRDFYHWDKRRFASDGKVNPSISMETKIALTQTAASKCQ